MNRVFLCSPFANFKLAVEYARLAMLDSINRGEAPFAPHLLYPQVLDEDTGRSKGFHLAGRWLQASSTLAVYQDFGISDGMEIEMKKAKELGIPIIHRNLFRYEKDASR